MAKRPTKASQAAKRRQEPQSHKTAGAAPRRGNRRKMRRRSNRTAWFLVGGTLVIVAAVIGLFIYLGNHSSGGSGSAGNGGAYPTSPADPTVVREITTIDPTILAAVGTGSGQVQAPPPKVSGSPPLLVGSNGKPEVFYYGAEFCPYCAAERWAMIVALSRFGTFQNLRQESSSSTDVYPSTPTLSFYHSSYSSTYLDFVPVEGQSYEGVTLQQPTADQQQLIATYDSGGGFPFVDIANRYAYSGASYNPQVLSGLDWQGVASALSDPQSPVAQAILGTANYLTAAICQVTNQQPASVCQTAPIPQVEQALNQPTGNIRGNDRQVSAIEPVVAASFVFLRHFFIPNSSS
jgi:thiol-disulfide isomerase/thioredoxin